MIKKASFQSRKWLILLFFIPFSIISWGFGDDFFQYGKQLEIFASVYREVNQYYVDDIKLGELMKTGINGMLKNLDPYTNYYPESEIEDYKMKHVSTEYGGIGASSFRVSDSVVIYEVYEGYPAQKAGLRPGDILLSVNGRTLKGLTPEEVDDLMKGQSGTSVKLTLARYGEAQPLDMTITREDIKVKNVPYYCMINDSTGYIKLDKFLQECYSEVRAAFVELKKNPKMTSLVFDLRGNGGGLLEESVNILNVFIDKGVLLVTQKGKISGSNNTYTTSNEPIDANIRVAVLVDKNSASASEITAGNFQDLDRGVIVGQRSYGKGLVQQTRPLTYNSQMKVTVAKYYTASGRCVQTKIYKHHGEDGASGNIIEEVADSVIKEFKTKGGRTVYDGSAVYPDRYVQPADSSAIAKSLLKRLLIFDYATRYRTLKPTITDADNFKISDQDYNDFIAFLDNKQFEYSTQTDRAFTDLKETVIKDKYYATLSNELNDLGSRLKHNQKDDLLHFKPEISKYLEQEIVTRYYFAKGKFQYMFHHDVVMDEALKVLGNQTMYTSILKGEGNYKIIGKPGAKK
jgi:carboxyl-terminal processing protease